MTNANNKSLGQISNKENDTYVSTDGHEMKSKKKKKKKINVEQIKKDIK